jgi:hypothetical protein
MLVGTTRLRDVTRSAERDHLAWPRAQSAIKPTPPMTAPGAIERSGDLRPTSCRGGHPRRPNTVHPDDGLCRLYDRSVRIRNLCWPGAFLRLGLGFLSGLLRLPVSHAVRSSPITPGGGRVVVRVRILYRTGDGADRRLLRRRDSAQTVGGGRSDGAVHNCKYQTARSSTPSSVW